MVSWTRVHGHGAHVKTDVPAVFTRPLGLTEVLFYWDATFYGVSDTLQQVAVESKPSRIFSPQNIQRTWMAVKRLHPLLGAYIYEENHSNVRFVVDESRYSKLAPDEIVFMSLQSDMEVQNLANKILNEPRTLSSEVLAKIWIIQLPQQNTKALSSHQVLFHSAHCICDGMAQNAIIRSFFDILVHADTPDVYLPKGDLESRLAPLLAIEDLYPARKYTVARKRWRIAIARVIHLNRDAASKGGHTLPRTMTPQNSLTPVISRTLRVTLPKNLSRRIIASCRRAHITLGEALPVLAQLAHARILHRLRSQGKISDEDWEYRIRQPMHMGGPANLRPYLDREWVQSGGAGRVCVAISFFGITLPFLPVLRSWSPDTTKEPEFRDLLSRARFFHRCLGPQKQTVSYMQHPLLTEFAMIMRPERIARIKATALKWRAQQRPPQESDSSKDPSSASRGDPVVFVKDDFVPSNASSSFGNVDNMIPPNYPIEHTGPRAVAASSLRLTSIQHYLRCRPAELYLTSVSYAQEIQFVLFCDVGAYGEDLAMQWLVEVGRAAEWYLGVDDAEVTRL